MSHPPIITKNNEQELAELLADLRERLVDFDRNHMVGTSTEALPQNPPKMSAEAMQSFYDNLFG